MPSPPVHGARHTLLAGAVLALVGCSLVIDSEQVQCETADDCAARGLSGACVANVCVEQPLGTGGQGGGGGGGGASPWGCLGQVSWPDLDPARTVTVRTRFQMTASQPIPDDITVKYCDNLDIDCASPLADAIPIQADGWVSVDVPEGTRGYFDLSGPSIKPTLVYFPRPAQAEPPPTEDDPITLITPALFQGLVSAVGFQEDPARGTLLVLTVDCTGNPAPGVRIASQQADADATPFYFVNLTPSPDQTQTDVSGFAGILNLPPGLGTVESRVASDDARIGVSSFQIRPGALTNVAVEPTPVQ
ncbi:MAG TPA: hypothetical protein VLS89_03000 [Candidatus Nanopelagicales bacterium]|nr:hypothetical protein [Candidatus Nanopelagicales bacterium]